MLIIRFCLRLFLIFISAGRTFIRALRRSFLAVTELEQLLVILLQELEKLGIELGETTKLVLMPEAMETGV